MGDCNVDKVSELKNKLMYLVRQRRQNRANLRQYMDLLLKLKRQLAYEKPLRDMQETPNAYEPWDDAQEKQLADLYNAGKTIEEITKILQGRHGGTRARLKRLGLSNNVWL
ncbi:MAG: hypothetical protein HY544_04050 [Candidatus Diapherotrites archaeon]|uniref:Uncharacterized protein n=1 Tax=Candidatus Iainarchaeum sp. TaxID=3101447 RepID=A0A8T3YR72_9ARCH|nr:hypothetical protein [Candidatus Diapherotrites archaeon]